MSQRVPPSPRAPTPTRRNLLLLAAGVVAGAGSVTWSRTGLGQAPGSAMFTKAFAGYVASGGVDRCDRCTRYVAGNGQDNGTCMLVEGTISREGWCKFFDD